MVNRICANCGHSEGFHYKLKDGSEGCLRGKIAGIQNKISCDCKKFVPKDEPKKNDYSPEVLPLTDASSEITPDIQSPASEPLMTTKDVKAVIQEDKNPEVRLQSGGREQTSGSNSDDKSRMGEGLTGGEK